MIGILAINTSGELVIIELKRDKDSQCYSLSRLREIIVNELGLTNVNADWGFGVRYEWITEDGKSLADLNEEP